MKKVIKRILIVIGILLLIFACLIGYFVYDDMKQEKILDEEINTLLELNLLEDDVDTKIVTRDQYAVIEKTIKDYIKDYSDNYKLFVNSIYDFNFEEMFTATTFATDGPDFIESKGKLSKLQDNVTTSLDKLVEMASEDYIMNLISNKKLDDYYIEIYKNYMFGENINNFYDEIEENISDINNLNKYLNLFFDDCYAIYDFLSSNRNNWYVEEETNTVYFTIDSLVNKYNELLNKVIEDSNAITEDNKEVTEEAGRV